MEIPQHYKSFFHKLVVGERATLEDAQTKLFIQVHNAMFVVDVDRGIVQNIRRGVNKCDFLIFDEINSKEHLIELKGAIIEKAIMQLEATIANISEVPELTFLLEGLNLLDAYIVSPGRQKIPRGIDRKERSLAQKLVSHCTSRQQDILQLIKHVKVVPKISTLTECNRQIICSNDAPLIF